MSSRRLLLALCIAVLAALPAFADRETSEFFCDRGEKALRADEFTHAEEHFKRALEEDETYHPARFGLARALLGSDRRGAAVTELRRFVTDARAMESLPGDWERLVTDAEKRLATLDAAGTELAKVVDGHVEALVRIAKKFRKKDPTSAKRALQRALELRPEHREAAALLEALGGAPGGGAVQLFNGRNLDGFAEMGFPTWQCKDGAIVGNVEDAAYIGRTEEVFEGDFEVRMEARILDEHPGPTMFGLCPIYDGRDGHYSIGLLKGKITWRDDREGDGEELYWASPSNLKGDFDGEDWNTYEMRFRGGKVTALVNGEVIGERDRPEDAEGGFVGIKVQNCRVAIRKVEVRRR